MLSSKQVTSTSNGDTTKTDLSGDAKFIPASLRLQLWHSGWVFALWEGGPGFNPRDIRDIQ